MGDGGLGLESILKIAEIVAVAGTGTGLFFKIGRVTERFEMIGKQQAKEITEIKNEVRAFGVVLTDVAVQKTRLDSQGERLNLLDRRYDELRHGEGFVYPLGAHLGHKA